MDTFSIAIVLGLATLLAGAALARALVNGRWTKRAHSCAPAALRECGQGAGDVLVL